MPLLCRIYPNGPADINQFGPPAACRWWCASCCNTGCCTKTCTPWPVSACTATPGTRLDNGQLAWREGVAGSLDASVIASVAQPFEHHGGTKVMAGNLGRAVMKTSAVPADNQIIEAPAVVFDSQHDIMPAFEAGKLDRDCVVVVRFRGRR